MPFERDWNPNIEQQSSRDYSELHNVNILAVTETLIESNYCYISPKTWRAIACKKPFVVVGNRGLLKKLQDMGFITFSDYWDESYDEEINLEKRIKKISKVLVKLSQLSILELKNLRRDLRDTVEFNQNLINSFGLENPMDKIATVVKEINDSFLPRD